MTSPSETGLSRRSLLITLGVLGGAGGGVFAAPAGAAAPVAAAERSWTGRLSQNGWPVIDRARTAVCALEGTGDTLRLRPGPVTAILQHVARRFHYEVSALGPGDVGGFATSTLVAAPLESNYLSGTAFAIRPDLYPAGSADNLFPLELLAVRDILAECEGVVRWGGDDATTPKEGHFQIDVPPGDPELGRVASRITGWRGHPGRGAGVTPDLGAAKRRAAAVELQRRQS